MKHKLIVSILAGLVLFGCAPQQKSSSPMEPKLNKKIIDARLGKNTGPVPTLIGANGSDFFVYKHNGRIFVVGSQEMSEKFRKQHHLPYNRTILGLGPKGETVVFEVAKKKPEYVARLQKKYENTPVLMEARESFWVWKYDGRIYVIGSEKTNTAFQTTHFLPYTKTILGMGPLGETVIFEVHKKKPEFAAMLKEKYEKTPILLKSEPHLYVWKYNGRIYVIGQEKTNKAFMVNHHLPYTKTILGAGPQGETVIFEVDKKNASLAENLIARY